MMNHTQTSQLRIDTKKIHSPFEEQRNADAHQLLLRQQVERKKIGVRPSEKVRKKIILLIDSEPATMQLINDCLTDMSEGYEILNAFQANPVCKVAESLKPELIIIDRKMSETTGLELVRQLKADPCTGEIPVIVFSEEKMSVKDIDQMLAAGAIDCLNKSIDKTELRIRIKTALIQMDLLNDFRRREERILQESERFEKDIERLQAEVNFKHRESSTHLELLIHSREVKDKLLDKIKDLRPYLNSEGKIKLSTVAKQLKWELNDERWLNLERKFDESNADFYKALEKRCPMLTKNEKRLCAYLKSNHSASSIAKITYKTSNSINVAFARIRSKLRLLNNKDLKTYLCEIQ